MLGEQEEVQDKVAKVGRDLIIPGLGFRSSSRHDEKPLRNF